MIQLAGIAAAEPGLLVEGGRISMVVVGARGEAACGPCAAPASEDVETAWGTVPRVKLVREARSPTTPAPRSGSTRRATILPARATMRNSAGAVEYDLLLERVEPLIPETLQSPPRRRS